MMLAVITWVAILWIFTVVETSDHTD